MKLRIAVLVVSILCSSLAYAQDQQTESLKHLPQEIRIFLDQKYPGWKFAPVSGLGMECYDVETKSHPSLTWGDFNGDSKTDFSVQIIQSGRISAYELLSHGKKFVVNVLFKNVLVKEAHVGALQAVKKGKQTSVGTIENVDSLEIAACGDIPLRYVFRNGRVRDESPSD